MCVPLYLVTYARIDKPLPENRLEHLGDSVLSLIVTGLLAEVYPTLRVGPATVRSGSPPSLFHNETSDERESTVPAENSGSYCREPDPCDHVCSVPQNVAFVET